MARSSSKDPIDKFRFKVTVLDFKFKGLTQLTATDKNTVRAGFSEVTSPRLRVGEVRYRENIDAPRFIKTPGLATYEPVTLRRGVVPGPDRELYNWFKEVHNDANHIGAVNDILANQGIIPIFPADFRRDLIIELLDRTGTTVKAWFLFDAFPIEYAPGDDLDAEGEAKLIQEVVLTYEAFIEQEDGDLGKLQEEAAKAATDAVIGGIASNLFS